METTQNLKDLLQKAQSLLFLTSDYEINSHIAQLYIKIESKINANPPSVTMEEVNKK